MNIRQMRSGTGIKPLKWALGEIPHLVIEPTLRCNLGCHSCYNRYRAQDKPLADIRTEIDLGLAKRRLETISILGGEPTLHPDLAAIVRYVKSKNLYCEILTNGLRLLAPGGDAYLDELVTAGLDRIAFHVDRGQTHVRPDPDADTARLLTMAEARRLWAALAITVYPETSGTIPQVMRRWSRFRCFDGVLVTLPRDAGKSPSEAGPDMLAEYAAIAADLKVEPVTYVPTSLDDSDVSWLIYFYDINTQSGETFGLSPQLNRLLRRFFRLVYGRNAFAMTSRPERRWFSFYGSALLELLIHPGKLGRYVALVRGSPGLRDIRLHYIVLQEPPTFNLGKQAVQMCYHCPDATIRNGRLTPVCLADRISPLPGGPAAVDEPLRRTVYSHLGEL